MFGIKIRCGLRICASGVPYHGVCVWNDDGVSKRCSTLLSISLIVTLIAFVRIVARLLILLATLIFLTLNSISIAVTVIRIIVAIMNMGISMIVSVVMLA